MSVEIIGIIGILLLLFMLFSGVWIGYAMAFVAFIGLIAMMGLDKAILVMGTVPYGTISHYPISALPLFVLMGIVVGASGIGKDLYHTAHKWFGRLPGGLAISTIFASGGFAAITGSSAAALVTLGSIAIPEMRKYNYNEQLAAGVVAAGGTIGILIPPSLGFILYAILTEESIGRLFMAGMIPGILEILFYVVTVLVICRIHPSYGPRGPKTTILEKIVSLKTTWPVLALFLLVIGGIYGGIFTPTEAGAVGAFGSIIIILLMRRLNFIEISESIVEALKLTGMIFILIIGAFLFSHFLAKTKLPFYLSGFVEGMAFNKNFILIIIVLLYILLGMFLEIFSCIVLTVPILFPTIQALGFETIWFGVIMVRVMEIGLITPPIGMNVYMLGGVTKIPLLTIFKGIIPFFVADLFHVSLLIMFPGICLWLPETMF